MIISKRAHLRKLIFMLAMIVAPASLSEFSSFIIRILIEANFFQLHFFEI